MHIDQLIDRNEEHAQDFSGEDLPPVPTLEVAVVTCMDCRIDIYRALGLGPGEAHVIRNAGGRARDALRSLIVSQRKLGTREIMLITHTTCGMASFNSGELQEELGTDLDFATFESPERAAAEDVAWLREHPLILDETEVRAFVYDVKTGALTEQGGPQA